MICPTGTKRESVVGNVAMVTHMFPAVIANPGFVSIKIETLSKVIKDIRRMFQMFETKPNYLKSTIETLEQGVKYFQS